MSSENSTDPTKKYWLLILVIVPIIIALIGVLPKLLDSGSGPASTPAQSQTTSDQAGSSSGQATYDISGDGNQVQIGDNNTQTGSN
ncbi:MAG: hypothetical protein GY802_09655 [Gammaproteobacteria bacterium]|nr:hypothetical protein [Gammaproteobacteria bacterium]